jgi:ATP-dependent protease ClpP protease subunit
MRYVRSDVQTICFGMAMSMGAILLAGGAGASGSRCPARRS